MPTIKPGFPVTPRTQINATARGLLSESSFSGNFAGGSIPTCNSASGQIVAALCGFQAGDVITNLILQINTIGVSVGFAKMGLWDSAGTPLAATASVSATMNGTTGFKVIPLTTPYTIPSTGGYYIGYLQFGAGATGAALGRVGNATVVASAIGSFPRNGGAMTNQTDVTGTLTLTDGSVLYWFGAS